MIEKLKKSITTLQYEMIIQPDMVTNDFIIKIIYNKKYKLSNEKINIYPVF